MGVYHRCPALNQVIDGGEDPKPAKNFLFHIPSETANVNQHVPGTSSIHVKGGAGIVSNWSCVGI